jgi:sporulation protein YlmC with PRC-barrel domain
MVRPTGRVFDLNLHLLDRQVIDVDGKLVCNVDDLEFERGADGALYVAAILVGQRVLGKRIGGRLGRWISSVAARLADTGEPPRIDMNCVDEIGSAITLNVPRRQLEVAPLEDWVHRNVVSRIPGSGHESE